MSDLTVQDLLHYQYEQAAQFHNELQQVRDSVSYVDNTVASRLDKLEDVYKAYKSDFRQVEQYQKSLTRYKMENYVLEMRYNIHNVAMTLNKLGPIDFDLLNTQLLLCIQDLQKVVNTYNALKAEEKKKNEHAL